MTITPDTKDWTWVLSRPCADCGFDGTRISGHDVPWLITKVADSWRRVLTGPGSRSGPEVAVRSSPERWSPLEYGCHVRDVLRISDARLQLMLIQAQPLFPNWDQDQTAVDADYGSQNADIVADGLVASAARFTADLKTLSPREWERTGRRSDGALFSVDSLARYVVHDPIHHLADVGVGVEGLV
jgi:DinB superfamily